MTSRNLYFLGLLLFSIAGFGQARSAQNGWYLPTSGKLRVLVLFAEIEYDVNPKLDPLPQGSKVWRKGNLPQYKDSLFDPFWTGKPSAPLTNYYAECSFNQFQVLGDYLHQVITVKESEVAINNFYRVKEKIREKINALGVLRTNSNLSVKDFNLWQKSSKAGAPSINQPDSVPSYDHVMLFLRNYHKWGSASGNTAPGTFRKLYGYDSDTHSQFTGGNHFPFSIVRHEFNHMLFGGNNFHVGGGLGAGAGYFIPSQGGWSMMGGANSCFLTCNAWDRDRLGWKPRDSKYYTSCLDGSGSRINGDMASFEGSKKVVLRDFITTGDALRLKLPNINPKHFQQWIWIENHQTSKNNGSMFDRFQYDDNECVMKPTPGIYMYLQVDKDEASGGKTFGGHGDYLRPMPADGCFDLEFEWTKQQNACVNQAMYYPFRKRQKNANPLSGNHDLEIPAHDLDSNGRIFKKEQLFLAIEGSAGSYNKNLAWLGHSRHAFTKSGNNKVNIGTNPSSASMMTLVSENGPIKTKRNNRSVVLNGISIEILEERKNGEILLEIRYDNTEVTENVRWCADTIHVGPGPDPKVPSLSIASGKKISLERGLTATRINKPETVNGEIYFNSPTNMILNNKAIVAIGVGSKIQLEENSKLIARAGSEIQMSKRAQIIVKEGTFIVEKDAMLVGSKKAQVVCSKHATFVNNSTLKFRKKPRLLSKKGIIYKIKP